MTGRPGSCTAEGQAKAIRTVFDAIHEANPSQKVLAYQYLQALPQIANGTANKVWIVPTELTQALEGMGGALGGLANMVGDLPTGDGRRGRRRARGRRGRRGRGRARPQRSTRRCGRPRLRSPAATKRDPQGLPGPGADPAVGRPGRRRLQRRGRARTRLTAVAPVPSSAGALSAKPRAQARGFAMLAAGFPTGAPGRSA